jgi:hypothetical protein
MKSKGFPKWIFDYKQKRKKMWVKKEATGIT